MANGQGGNPFDALKNIRQDQKKAEAVPTHEEL